jgi:CheY-like chemotaxis protein
MQSPKRLVIVEDDEDFARTLARSFERRGYDVATATGPQPLDGLLEEHDFDFAVVDLKLGAHSGLPCVEAIHRADPSTRIVVLTGFASIATAVEAISLGRRITFPSRPTPTISKPLRPRRWRLPGATRRPCYVHQDAGMGEDQRDSNRHRLQHLRDCAQTRHASADAG